MNNEVLTSPNVDEQCVRSLTEDLLNRFSDANEQEFWGAQFDLGLARVESPRGCGGLDAEPALQRVIDLMLEAAGRLGTWKRNSMGIGMCGPTIVTWGTEAQKSRLLRPIFTAEEIWCQLFSEPGAGSDLASLATRAVRDGDEWTLNGQKVWTSRAHEATWGLLLARTDPDVPSRQGVTAFILQLAAPGVEIRPLRQMTGDSTFNEVWLTEVRVPDEMRVGPVGEGWKVGTTTLMNERVSIGGNSLVPQGRGPIAEPLELWARSPRKDPTKRTELAQLWIEAEVLRLLAYQAQARRQRGVPGPEGSLLKLGNALLRQRIGIFVVGLLGAAGTLCDYNLPSEELQLDPVIGFLGSRSRSLGGGTSEIMRNMLAERILGLPREPQIDPSTPWSQIPRS